MLTAFRSSIPRLAPQTSAGSRRLVTVASSLQFELFCVHPKVLAVMYFAVAATNAFVGAHLSAQIRLMLTMPLAHYDVYYTIITYHGLILIFFYLMPLLYGCFGNFVSASHVGISDMMFPRFNISAVQLLVPASVYILFALLGHFILYCGWVLSPPVSMTRSLEVLIFSLHLSGVSSIATSLNLVVTSNMNHRTHSFRGLISLLLASFNTGNVLVIFSLPVLAAGITMLLLDHLNVSDFFTSLAGDVLIYHHLFWFFGHPEVYILILPCFGIESYLFTAHIAKHPLNVMNMTLALMTICYLSCAVWGHHLYTVHMSKENRDLFSFSTVLIGVPTGIKFFTWLSLLNEVGVSSDIPVFATWGFLFIFFWGGITGMIMGNAGLDVVFHDTYYVVGHFHIIMAAAITYIVYYQSHHIFYA